MLFRGPDRINQLGIRSDAHRYADFRHLCDRLCGCRKLVRTAELRLGPSGGHRVMDLRSCAIHPNHPVADALGTSGGPCDGWTQ